MSAPSGRGAARLSGYAGELSGKVQTLAEVALAAGRAVQFVHADDWLEPGKEVGMGAAAGCWA